MEPHACEVLPLFQQPNEEGEMLGYNFTTNKML